MSTDIPGRHLVTVIETLLLLVLANFDVLLVPVAPVALNHRVHDERARLDPLLLETSGGNTPVTLLVTPVVLIVNPLVVGVVVVIVGQPTFYVHHAGQSGGSPEPPAFVRTRGRSGGNLGHK
jgi:hypothetical protein